MRRLIALLLVGICVSFTTEAQQLILTRKPNVNIHPECQGFVECLPSDYATSGKKYPLLIVTHGTGECGNGSSSDLGKLVNLGPMRLISNGTFPTSFTVNGVARQFIIIAPQFTGYNAGSSAHIEAVFKYVTEHYRVDPTRLYASGLSMGGQYTWGLGSSPSGIKLAAILPICGQSESYWWVANPVAAANLPVWATTNNADPTVNPAGSIGTVQLVNNASTNKSLAKVTVFNAPGHDAWTHTYDPVGFREDGLNAYEWLLTKTRGFDGDIVLPVVLKSFDASISGSNVLLKWITSSEQHNDFFTLERSVNGTDFTSLSRITAKNNTNGGSYSFSDSSPADGSNYYRLSQTDKDGKTTYFEIVKILVNESVQNDALKLYPNPSVDYLNIALNNAEKGAVKVSVITNDGRLLTTMAFNKGISKWNQRIDVSKFKPGFYMLKIDIGATSLNTKFVKQ